MAAGRSLLDSEGALTKEADKKLAKQSKGGGGVPTATIGPSSARIVKHLTAAVAYPILGLRPVGSFGFCVVYWGLFLLRVPF
jgi:nitrate reductase NapE component